MKWNAYFLRKCNLFGFVVIWVIGFWWVARPFTEAGYHDGLLYTADALRHLYPENFAKDVGSSDVSACSWFSASERHPDATDR